MKNCCKTPENWHHDGSRDKKTRDMGTLVRISSQNYLTCKVCGGKLAMYVEKNVVTFKRRPKIIKERA